MTPPILRNDCEKRFTNQVQKLSPDHRNVAVLHRPVESVLTEDGVDGLVGLRVDIGRCLADIDLLVVDGNLVLGRHGDWRGATQTGREEEKAIRTEQFKYVVGLRCPGPTWEC